MIKDYETEVRPTAPQLHVPFADYQAVVDENKKLREAVEAWLRWHDKLKLSGGIVFAEGTTDPKYQLIENMRDALAGS